MKATTETMAGNDEHRSRSAGSPGGEPRLSILVVEDDDSIRFGLCELLEQEGFRPCACGRGDEAVECVRRERPGLVLLDVMLPGKSGFDICKEMRSADIDVPVIMLTAKGQELDKVIGLECGADDYITKPFGVRELIARIHALLRRTKAGREGGGPVESLKFRVGDAVVYPRDFQVERDGAREALTPKELGVLVLLYGHRGEVLSRDELLDKVWGLNYYGTTRTVDQTVAQIRKKIGDAGKEPSHLLTVHGVGYKLRRE